MSRGSKLFGSMMDKLILTAFYFKKNTIYLVLAGKETENSLITTFYLLSLAAGL